jgi:hypothetical protein
METTTPTSTPTTSAVDTLLLTLDEVQTVAQNHRGRRPEGLGAIDLAGRC